MGDEKNPEDKISREGRTTKTRRKELSRTKRKAYWKAVSDIQEEGRDYSMFRRCPLCGKVA